MATETEIPESVYLKKGERDDNVLSSEALEENVTELLSNKVKQLESGSSQPPETSSQVAEAVNTQLEIGKPTNESETCSHALSVPLVTSKTRESCEVTTTEDQEESKMTKIEDFKEGKPNIDDRVKAVSTQTEPEREAIENEEKYDENAIEKEACEGIGTDKAESELELKLSDNMTSSKEEVLNMLEKDQGDNDDVISSQDATCDNLKETTIGEHATTMADFKEQDLSEKPREFLKEETEDKLIDAQEASEQSENGTKDNREEKPEESVKKSEQDKDTEEIRRGVQIEEKTEQNGLLHNITTDVCISTQTTSQVEITEHEEKDEEEAGKSESPSIKEVCEETGSEKAEYQKQEVNWLEKDKDHEKEQEVIMLTKDQDEDEVINVKDVTFEGGLEEKSQRSEDNDHEVVKAKESIEEDTEEIRKSVETPEKTEQQRLINVIPTDVCIAVQTEPEEKVTENEEKNDEEANGSDDGQPKKSEKAESEEWLKLSDSSTITLKENEKASKDEDQQKEQELYMSEKGQTQSLAEEEQEEMNESKNGQKENSDNLSIKEACKDTDSEKLESERVEFSDSSSIKLKEKTVATLSKDEAEEKEQELNMSEQDQKEAAVTCSRDASSIEDLQAKTYDTDGKEPEFVKAGETIEEDSEEMKSSVEIKEKVEQQGLLPAITTDVCISTQAELQEEAIKNEEKAIEIEEKAIESYGDQKGKSDNLFVKEVCEATDLKKTEAEEGIKLSDSSNMLASLQDAAPEEEDLQEKSYHTEGNTTEIVTTTESIDEIKSSVETKEDTEQQGLLHVITTDVCSSAQTEATAETLEIEEKNEEAIENDDGQTKPENLEKEQELKISEVQNGGDDVKTSQNEDKKKTEIGQHATTVAYFEARNFGETTKEIINDEAEAIDVQESNGNEDGTNEKREQMPEGIVNKTLHSCSEIQQDKYTEEIIPSVESNAKDDVFISIQTESQEEATKNDEKATERDSDRKEKSDNPFVKEVYDETDLEKSEYEKGIELLETSNLNLDEKSISVVSKDEDQEKEQELKDATAVYEESLQEKSYDGEGNEDKILETRESIKRDIEEQEEQEKKYQKEANEPELVEARRCVDDDTEEIISSVETKENTETKPKEDTIENEEQKDEDAIENDDDQTKKSDSPLVKEVCEATSSEKAESEEAVKHSDSFSTTFDENEKSKEDNLEQEQELKISEIQGDEHDVISSRNASNEDIKEKMIGQYATTVAYFEEVQGVSAKTEEIIKEKAEDESIDAQEASEQCENGAKDKTEQNPEESINKAVNSCSEIVEGNVKEDEGNKEIEAKQETDSQADRTLEGSEMKDEVVSTEKMSLELGQPKEQNVEFIQACLTETISEKTEDEITKKNEDLSYDKIEDKNGNTNTEDKTFLDGRTREIEISTLEHAPVEEKNGDLNEVSNENYTDLNETAAVEPQEDSTPSNSLETSTEDSSNLEKVKAESENLPKDDLESASEVQIPEVLPTSEESKLKEECLNSETIMHVDEEKGTITKDISSDEKQATEIKQETFEELCEETSSEKAELEESDMEINEKAVTFNDEDQEKDRDVNISTEGQGKDNVTSSHDAASEKENLQEKSHQNEGDEHEFLETRESVDKDTKEIKSSVKTEENKSETPLFKEECEATTSEKAESEDGVKHSEAFTTKPEENEIVSKEENLQKEQELTMSEVQGDGDDVTSTNEDIKETTISQPATMVDNFEEGQDLSAMTKEILEEEAGDKSIDAQEANKECQDGAKDESEQFHEENVNKPVKSCVEIVEGHITEDEANARDNEIEAKLDEENQVDRTDDRGEMEDEVVSAGKIPSELGQPKELNVEEIETCLTKTMTEKTKDEITKKENDSSHDSIEDTNGNTANEEKCTLEHESVEEQNGGLDEVSKEILTDLNETTAVEPEKDITPSSSLGTSTEDTSNSEKEKAESESLPMEDLVSVSEEHIPEVMPKSEDLAIATYVDKEKGTAMKEISSDQNLEPYREHKIAYQETTDDPLSETTQQPEKSHITSEENVTQLEQIAENDSPYGERDMEEDVTQEDQLNSTEDCSEMVKDVISTKEIEQVTAEIQKKNERTVFEEQVVDKESYSQNQKEMAHEISYPDPIPVGKSEMTEVKVDAQIGQEDLQVAEDISCESKVKNDSVDQAPKQEQIPSLQDAATLEPEVDLSNTESTAYPTDSGKLPIQALEPVCDVQTSEVITDSEDSKVKEECIVLETAGYTDENKVEEEQKIRTGEISSAPDTEEENDKQALAESDKEMSDLNTEEKSLTKEKLGLLGKVEPTSESVIEKDQLDKTNPQPEQSDIASENIMNETLEIKLEHTKEKKLEDVKRDLEEDVTLAPENQIKGIEKQNETEKNVILTDQVAVETTKENERNEVEGQVSGEDNCTTKLDTTSTSNQKELTNEHIEYSKPIPVGNTEVTEMKAESHLELDNIQAAEDLGCLSKASSTLEASNTERGDGAEKSITTIREVKDDSVDEASKDEIVPVREDTTELELEANLPEIKPTDIPLDSQDSMKLTEGMPCSTQETIEEKDGELISEVETPEALVKMGIQKEYPETTNDTCDTPTAGISSEKLLDEPEKLDAKDDIEEIAEGEEKAFKEYQDAVAGVTGRGHFSQTEEKLESMVPPEELTPPTDEDQTNELALETDKTKIEHGSLSNKDQNPELVEEEFTKPYSEDQSIKERYVEEEVQGNCGVEDTEEKSGNEVVEDVIVREVLMEDETAKESKSIKDNINEKPIHNQLMSVTHEVSQIERLSSCPNELLETKDLVEDAENPKLMAETLEIKDETFTVMKEPNKDIDIAAPEIENLENMVTEEKIIKADAYKEKEPLEEPQADDPVEAVSDSISSSLEQDIDVRSEESKGQGAANKPEYKPAVVSEITSEVAEIVPEDREASAILTDDLQEASPEMLLAKHDPELTTTTEKIEDEIKDKEVACQSVEKTEELQVSTLNYEIVEGKQNGPDDMQNKEREPVQPHEHISNTKFVDPPSDVEIREQEKLIHCGSQESSTENALLSHDKKIEDSLTLQSVEKEIMQGLHKGVEETPFIEVQKHEKGLDHTTEVRTVDVVNNAECSEIEPPQIDTKKATSEFVNEDNQRDEKNEADEHKEAATPSEDVKSSTKELEVPSVMDEKANKEGYNEDPKNKKAEAYEAEKGTLKDNEPPESTFDISKPTEEVSGIKQEPLELDAPTTLGTAATEDLKISQKYVTDVLINISQTQPKIQKYEVPVCTVDKQSPNEPHETENKLLAKKIDASHEQAEPTEKSFTADAEDLNATKASGTEAQCSSEVTKEERNTSDEKEKSESAEPAKILLSDMLHEPTKENSEVAEKLIKEIEPALTKDQQVDKEETVDSAVKTDDVNVEDNEKLGSCSDTPVMVEASKDKEVKVHKKSHNMLSGVGSKVKHSIAKVKKAITGKSFHTKPPSP